MKLSSSRPGTAGPKNLADLKIGMNRLNRSGVQQNTACLFQSYIPEDIEKEDTPIKEVDNRIPCKSHCGYKKPLRDQQNPYILRKSNK